MHPRDSRYRSQDEVLRSDASGRDLVTTGLRRPPDREGALRHLVEEGDRLDHLGQRYYRRPHRWWEICDANPQALSPLRLLGQDPVSTLRILVLEARPPDPPLAWHAVVQDLRDRAGVEQVAVETQDVPEPAGLITVRFNHLSVAATALIDAVAAQGLDPARAAVLSGAAGTSIAVPPPLGTGRR